MSENITKILSRQNAEHYTWGQDCDGWHLLKSDSLSVIKERMPPGTYENRHYHDRSQQVFFILSGQALLIVEDEEYRVQALESLHVKNGLKHQIKNIGDQDLYFLVISEPKSHGDRINC